MNQVEITRDDLVRRAEKLIGRLDSSENWDEGIGKTQASNAIQAAREAESLNLFLNWLRYQTARERDSKPFWSASFEGKTLAEAITDELNEIHGVLKGDAMPSVRLLLGYLRRALFGIKYLDKIKVEGEG